MCTKAVYFCCVQYRHPNIHQSGDCAFGYTLDINNLPGKLLCVLSQRIRLVTIMFSDVTRGSVEDYDLVWFTQYNPNIFYLSKAVMSSCSFYSPNKVTLSKFLIR